MKTILASGTGAILASVIAFAPLPAVSQDRLSVAQCAGRVEGGGRGPGSLPLTFDSVAYVWINGERTMIQIGERGLTRTILFNPELLLQWALENFGTGLVLFSAGYNDCMGSQQVPRFNPFSPIQEDNFNPDNFVTNPVQDKPEECEFDCPPPDDRD